MTPLTYRFTLIALLLLGAAKPVLTAQCINGTDSYPIYQMGEHFVTSFDEQGFEIVRIEYDLIFTSKESFRNLTSAWEYTILGFADGGVKDLDLKVYAYNEATDKWSLVSEDASEEPYAIVTVKPDEDALYKVEVIVYAFHEGYTAARYGLMYIHE